MFEVWNFFFCHMVVVYFRRLSRGFYWARGIPAPRRAVLKDKGVNVAAMQSLCRRRLCFAIVKVDRSRVSLLMYPGLMVFRHVSVRARRVGRQLVLEKRLQRPRLRYCGRMPERRKTDWNRPWLTLR